MKRMSIGDLPPMIFDYSNILKNKAIVKNEYRCNHCKLLKNGKPWTIYNNNGLKNICSYICHTRERELYPVWDNLIYVEDFNILIDELKLINLNPNIIKLFTDEVKNIYKSFGYNQIEIDK